MHKVFVSYHHSRDQEYKNQLTAIGQQYGVFIDRSVRAGAVSDDLTDEQIRKTIRDKWLRDSTVTIVLVGAETRRRKHVDWEIYSSMYDGQVNKKSGVLAITLPMASTDRIHVSHGPEELALYRSPQLAESASWEQWRRECPGMPDRIVDNIVYSKAMVSVSPWHCVARDPHALRELINLSFRDRKECRYDLRRPMRRHNS